MDELKVQLESRQDLEYLRGELGKYLDENAYTTTKEQRDRFLEDVFAILAPSLQIDGIDLDKLSPDSGEAVDTQLEAQLESLQAETDQLLVAVTEMRRKCPEDVRKRFALELEDLERCMPGVQDILSPLPEDPKMDNNALSALSGELERLKSMNETIPTLVAKLRRAQTVLDDAAGEQKTKNQLDAHQLPQPLADMLSRQRRITRQHDLAAKLLMQN